MVVSDMKIDTLTITGVGLIGGSIGMVARQRGLAKRVIGVGRDMSRLETARALGAIDEGTLDLAHAVREADIAVFCTPVDRIADQVLEAAPACRPGTLLTDAGSAKAKIVAAIEGRLRDGVAFVGSHPLAGSEKRGPEHAAADLFVGRWTVVTPSPGTDPAAVARTREFWEALGARVRLMTPEDHDRALAMTSHLPHLTAAALAGILPSELFDLTATGFRDTTRVAAGDPALWSAIFAQNRQPVLDALDRLSGRLQEFRRALENQDSETIHTLLTQAKKVRDALGS
jgi:prephenate dehydrogenase